MDNTLWTINLVEGLVNTRGRVGYGLVPGLQCHSVHAGSRESFFIRSLHGLSHWKNVIHLSGGVLLGEVVAGGDQGCMWEGFQGAPYTGKTNWLLQKFLFHASLHICMTHCRQALAPYGQAWQ